MSTKSDPLDMVRESRIRMSHEVDNDPSRMISVLRKQETKYTNQIEKHRLSYAKVAETRAKYGTR